jgi:hypothetical protein
MTTLDNFKNVKNLTKFDWKQIRFSLQVWVDFVTYNFGEWGMSFTLVTPHWRLRHTKAKGVSRSWCKVCMHIKWKHARTRSNPFFTKRFSISFRNKEKFTKEVTILRHINEPPYLTQLWAQFRLRWFFFNCLIQRRRQLLKLHNVGNIRKNQRGVPVEL